MNVSCSPVMCPVILNSTCVFYEGDNLAYTGILTNDSIQTALQKIDETFGNASIGYLFTNGTTILSGNIVGLGGALTQNTSITGAYDLSFEANLEAASFVVTGGSSTDFLKGDGSLDSTSYQPSGNYITALTGDGAASGPGSAVFTLTTVNSNPGTYGNNVTVPQITVNAKGLITAVTPVSITVPSSSLSFTGDVSGIGNTGSNVVLTLDTVNGNVFGINTPLKFAVNGKGLVTSAALLTSLDLDGIYGFHPVTDDRTITINGVTQNLKNNRSWTIGGSGTGTVTNVAITAGTGISASVADPTTTPNITITNTAPDQVVVLTPGTDIGITGSYPNFTISYTGVAPTNYITSVGDTATIDLDVTLGQLTANFSSLNISQFTNDAGYLTSSSLQDLTVSTGLQLNTGTTYNTSAARTISIDSTVVTLTGAQALSNKTGLISQWTNDSGYITSTGITPAALTKTDDTNVTLTLGGTPATALLQATSLTLGWTGTLADARITSSANWNTAYTNRITSLTTIGTSGAATLIANTLNIPQYQAAGTYVTSVSGTTDRITSSGGTTPIIDIAATYVGQSSITTLGTIGTGTWQGSLIDVAYGGTGTSTIFTTGSIVYAGASGVYSQNNSKFFWDNTNETLFIGANSTTFTGVKINSIGTVTSYMQNNIQNLSANASASSDWVATANDGTDSTKYIDLGINSSGWAGTGMIDGQRYGYLYTKDVPLSIGTDGSTTLRFFTGGTASTNERLSISSAGSIVATLPVTTGTGSTAGFQFVANSLTTGNGLDISSSSVTSGKILKVAATGTAINHTLGTSSVGWFESSGANASSLIFAIGLTSKVTNTGTSNTNVAAHFEATGATNNYGITSQGTATFFTGLHSINNSTGASVIRLTAESGAIANTTTSQLFLNRLNGTNGNATINNSGTGSINIQTNGSTTRLGISGTGLFTFSPTTLGAGTGVDISASTTDAASNTQKLFNVALSGANATSTQSTYAGYFSNTKTGTSSTNYGGYFTASGGTTNYGIYSTAGTSGILSFTDAGGYTGGGLAIGRNDISVTTAIFAEHASAGTFNIIGRYAGGNTFTLLWSFLGTYGGTNGLVSGRTAAFYDNQTSTYLAGFSAGAFYIGPSATNYAISANRVTSGQAITIGATANTTFAQSSHSTTHTFLTFTQSAHTGGSPVGLLFTGGAHVTLAASEAIDVNFNFARTVQFASGGVPTTQRAFRIQAPTYSIVSGSGTITTASTVSISNQPQAGSGVTITNPFAVNIEAGAVGLAGSGGVSGQVLTSSGAGATPTWTTISGISGLTATRIPYASGATTLVDDASLIYDTTNGIQTTKHLKLTAAGGAIYIKQGSNATCGRATLSGGTVTVNTTAIATADEIFLTDRGGTVTNLGTTYISAVVAGTSFTITSTNVLDASDVSWIIIKAA